jgi:hypothetical protein
MLKKIWIFPAMVDLNNSFVPANGWKIPSLGIWATLLGRDVGTSPGHVRFFQKICNLCFSIGNSQTEPITN